MKVCPKCGYELFGEAHFCPKCMYEYPRVEIKARRSGTRKRIKYVIILLLFLVVFFRAVIWGIRAYVNDKEEQNQPQNLFEDGLKSPYNEEIEYDLQGAISSYGENVRQELGDSKIVELDVDVYGLVDYIYIDYRNADEMSKKIYGIHGFNGETTKAEVDTQLGNPDLIEGETEYYYRFAGMIKMPILHITYDENNIVQEMEFYYD